jgi:uncharacterized repeat protein (TIGR01451 family)
VFTDTPEAGTTLLAGSVSSTMGTVTQGNTTGDRSVAVTLATLPPGAVVQVSFAVRVDDPLPAGITLLRNQGLLTATENPEGEPTDDPTTPADDDPTATPLQGIAALHVVKTDVVLMDRDGDGQAGPGDTLRYVMLLTNTGTAAATGVQLTDTPDSNSALEVDSVVTSQGTVTLGNDADDTSVAVNLGTLNARASATVRFDVVVATPLAAGVHRLRNHGVVTANGQPDVRTDDPETPTPDDATETPLAGAPDLRLTKEADGVSSTPGAPIIYTLDFVNAGTQDATGVTLTEIVPAHTTFVAEASTAGWICLPDATAESRCTLTLGALTAGASSSVTFAVTVATPLPAEVTTVVNTASIADNGRNGPDATPENNDARTTTRITITPALLVTKLDALTTDADTSGDVTPGDTLTYVVEIRNVGDTTVRDLVFTDAPDANTTLVAGSVTTSQGTVEVGNTAGDTTVTVAVGAVPGGDTVLLTFAAVLNTPLPSTVTQVANQGLVTATELPGVLSDDPETPEVSDPTRTSLRTAPRLEAIKTITADRDADASGGVTPGDTLLYFVTLRNIGLAAATDVVFTDTPGQGTTLVPETVTTTAGTVTQGNTAGATAVAVAVDTVEAGALVTISYMVQVNNPLPAGVMTLRNHGLVTALDDPAGEPTDDPNTPDNNDPTDTPVQGTVQLAAVKTDLLVVDGNGDGQAGPGDTVRYVVTLRNTGTATATGVQLTDRPDSNSTLEVGSVRTSQGIVTSGNTTGDTDVAVDLGPLEGGAHHTVRFDVAVNDPLPRGVGQLRNQGRLVATGQREVDTDDPTTAATNDPTLTPLQAVPDLQVTKEAEDTMARPGEVLRYTLQVTNAGRQEATGVILRETVPAYTSFDAEASSEGWECTPDIQADSRCTLELDPLAAEANAMAIFAVTVSPNLPAVATQIANTARVADDRRNGPDPVPEDNTTSITTPIATAPQLAVTKTDSTTVVSAGDTLTYRVEVTNPGAVEVVDVVFTDAPDANTTLVVDSVKSSQGTVITGNTAGDSTITVALDSLLAGARVTITFEVVVNTPLPGTVTQVANQGLVTGAGVPGVLSDDPETPQVADPTVTPLGQRPLLQALKRDVGVADGVTAGDTVRYVITLINAGHAAATDVVFTDIPGTHTALVVGTVSSSAGTIRQGNTAGDTMVTVDVGTVAPGARVIIRFAVQLSANVPPRVTTVTNQGLVTSTETPKGVPTDDPDTPAAADSTATPIQGRARLTAVKTAVLQTDADGDGVTGPGDTVHYVITVTNAGTAPATAVRFTDTPDPHTTLVVDSVVAPQGIATRGNVPGDTDVAVMFARVGAGESVTLSFQVLINPTLPLDAERIANQGTVDAPEAPPVRTDDPTTPTEDDATEMALAGTGQIGDLVWQDLDGDGARAAGEPGLAGVTVVLTAAGPDGRFGTVDDIPFPAQSTAANGVYAFTALRRGIYRVAVEATTLPAGSVPTTDNVPLTVVLNAGAVVADADFGYQQQGRVSGHLFTDRNRDGVQQPDEPDLVGVTIHVTESQGGTQIVTTDTEGNYVALVPVGTTTVAVEETTVPAGLVLTTHNAQQTVTVAGNAETATQPVGYGPANTPPVAVDDSDTTQVDTPVTIPVLANDRDPDGDTLTIVRTTPPTHGVVTINSNGTLTYTPQAGFVGSDTFTYTIRDAAGNLATATVTVTIILVVAPQADLAIQKTGPGRIESGETLTYTLTVRNAGPDAAVDIVVTDPTPEGLTFLRAEIPCRTGFPCAIDRLEAGTTQTFTVSFRVPSDYAGPDPIRNTVAIANSVTDPDPSNNSITSATAVARPAQADLLLTKAGPPSAARGSTVTYTLTVSNNGSDDASTVVIDDPTPQRLTFVEATPPCTAGFPCTLGTLNAEASVTVQVTFAIPATYDGPDPIVNTATVASTTTDPNPGNNMVSISTPVGNDTIDLALTKTGPTRITLGADVTYTLVVTNNGPAPATGVSLEESGPAELVLVSASVPCEAGFPCILGTLNAHESRTVTMTFHVPTTYTGPNPLINLALVAANERERDLRNNSASAVTGIATAAADVLLTKRGPTLVLAGEVATYTLVVTNFGPGPATNISLDDSISAPVELVAISAPCADGFPCNLGDLAAGSAVALTVTFRVPEPYTGANPLTNTATVTSEAPDPDPANDRATAQTFVNAIPTGACLFQYRALLVPTPGQEPDGDQDDQDPEGSDDPVDEGSTSQTTPPGPVLRLTTPQEGDVVTGTVLAVAVAQAPVRALTVSQLRTVTVANGAAPAQLDISEQPGTKVERLTAGQAQVVITTDRVVVELPAAAVRSNDVLEVATVETAVAPGILPGEVVGNLIALTLASGQATFEHPVTLRLPYADADHDGFVDGTSPAIAVPALTLWAFDEVTEAWVQVPEALVLPDVQSVIAPLTAVTVVGLFLADDGSQGQVGFEDATARPVRSGNGNTRGTWQTIGRTTSVPLVVAWNTTGLANGPYALRAVCAATPEALTIPSPPPSGADMPQGQGGGDSGCFIATAAFGSPLAPQVQVLRAFRDHYLLPNTPGRWLVQHYETVSPSLADAIRDRAALRGLVRVGLTPVVWCVWVVMHGTGTHTLVLIGFILLVGLGMRWCVSRCGR